VLGAFLAIAALILPLSWQVIHAELAHSRNMKAMDASIAQLKKLPCSSPEKSWQQLQISAQKIPLVFTKLARQSEFLNHQRELLNAIMQAGGTCVTLTSDLARVQRACKACHETYRSGR
jgi:cytochrome c556